MPAQQQALSLAAKLMRHTFSKIIIVLVVVWLMQSCRKDIPKGQLISAYGTVIDFVQQKPLPFVKLYLLAGHKYGPVGLPQVAFDTIPLDSVTTDINGNFSIKYYADGKSADYALGIIPDYLHPTNTENYLPYPSQPLYRFNSTYNLNAIIINAVELHKAIVRLQIISNPYDTILFRIYDAASGQSIAEYQLFGKSIDTTLGTRYLPLSKNVFEYSVRTLRLIDSASNYIRLTADSLNLGNVDSVFISKKFNSTYDIPLKPY